VRLEFAEYEMDTRDGVKVIMPDGWLLVRGSNTEPIVRVVAEAKNEERARELVQDMIDKIRI
jgi:phosphomannomutase/phosphoglucomutase